MDLHAGLDDAPAALVKLMGLFSGWILLKEPVAHDGASSGEYRLAAHDSLPPALAPDDKQAWPSPCACARLGCLPRPAAL